MLPHKQLRHTMPWCHDSAAVLPRFPLPALPPYLAVVGSVVLYVREEVVQYSGILTAPGSSEVSKEEGSDPVYMCPCCAMQGAYSHPYAAFICPNVSPGLSISSRHSLPCNVSVGEACSGGIMQLFRVGVFPPSHQLARRSAASGSFRQCCPSPC